MTKESISSTLRRLRENQRLTVKEVQEKLLQLGISVATKTIYGWESGKRLPDADTFLTLCDIYKSEDILEDFGYKHIANKNESVLAAAHQRTDIDIPRGTDTSDDDIMDDENF